MDIVLVSILHNEKAGTYHPILYRDAPLPGGMRPRRLKSLGHHTAGFATIEEAKSHLDDARYAEAVKDVAEPLEWDGEGIPADVRFM